MVSFSLTGSSFNLLFSNNRLILIINMKKNQTGTNSENLLALRPNKRQGDWVCVLCNNLNYSFRDTCNRCKNMTREENSTFIKSQKKDRNPLGELVFNRHSSQK